MKKTSENSLYWLVINRFRQHQLLRFLAVGTLNTGFSFGVYSSLIYLGWDFRLANFLALVIGVLFSFKTQSVLVFFNSDNRLLWRFIIGWAVIYFATIELIGYFISLGLDAYSAGALAVPFSAMLSYLIQKRFVFYSRIQNVVK